MEPGAASRRMQSVRMEEQDRVSQASSVATISYFPVRKDGDGKVQTFGKRCQAAKRDPNCPVVIRGWLNKKDSSGLKLWKRRWFVLSNYCLYYYKDSREESVLGSIPLPSYKILFCTPRECKNRKNTFKVVHQGMRSYFFSADTQEDMLGWVRALSQSAAMDPDSSMNRRCSSYQDFTQIGGSSESMEFPRSPSDAEGPCQKHRHVSRALSEPSQLTGGRMGTPHAEQRGRRSGRQSPYARTPSPPDLRRRSRGPNQEDDFFAYTPGQHSPPTHSESMGTGTLTSRGQLASRPHTPVGRVDIRPHDDLFLTSTQMLCYAPASPKLEFKSTPNTPGTERWQNLSKPTPVYGSVHHVPSGRRSLGKSFSTGAHADLLPPLPPSSRATHAPQSPHHHHHHHHHHRSHLSPPKPDTNPLMRPLESDADAVLTRLCGCDKLLQSLSVELAQLQMDKDSVQCALEVSRLQLEEWTSQGPRAQEEAFTQKALLQEELVTIRARMCDVSVEMERVWGQYERMESELSVIRSQLQHICNFGIPQEQSQAQRELWMMEDILAGLKVNREHFCLLLGLQIHHISPPAFHHTAPHPGSPGSPTERRHSDLPMEVEQEPPTRPPLPQELQESNQSRDHGGTESPYEGVYSHAADPAQRSRKSRPDLLNVKAQKDAPDSQSGSKWITPDTTNQPTKKKVKMSEEEQLERIKRNQERLANRKKPPIPNPGAQTQGQSSEAREEAPFPLRVTRVVTAVLPTSLVARRVSVEDPPPELNTPLPEQIPPEMQQRLSEQSKKILSKPPRRLLLMERADLSRPPAETPQDHPIKKKSRHQHAGPSRASKQEPQSEASKCEPAETWRTRGFDRAGVGNGSVTSDARAEEPRPSDLLTPDTEPDLCLTSEQREAKLRRVERIRERVIRSAARERGVAHDQPPIRRREGQEDHQAQAVANDTSRKQGATSDRGLYEGYRSCGNNIKHSLYYGPADLQPSSGTSQDEDELKERLNKSKSHLGSKMQRRDYGGRKGAAKPEIKSPPSSPHHISSVTFYQKRGGEGFTSFKDVEEEELAETHTDESKSDFSSAELRAKWFLSTNQWQGFIPLQIHGLESPSDEISDVDNQTACADEVTDSTEMSPTVSQSLEKMKENHSLFYKIACDISISDSDIARNDGNSNGQVSSRPEEGVEPTTSEYIANEASACVRGSSDQEIREDQATASAQPSSNTSSKPEKETSVYEDIPDPVKGFGEDDSRKETDRSVSVQGPERSVKRGEEHAGAKESEDRKVDQERPEELKKSERNLREEEYKEVGNSIPPCGSPHEGEGVNLSGSFGNARVTVLRTSL